MRAQEESSIRVKTTIGIDDYVSTLHTVTVLVDVAGIRLTGNLHIKKNASLAEKREYYEQYLRGLLTPVRDIMVDFDQDASLLAEDLRRMITANC